MNETEYMADVGNAPRRFWMKKALMVLGGLLFISISINVILWFKTLQEMHTSVSSVKEELEEVSLWVQAFQKSMDVYPQLRSRSNTG